VVGMRSRASGVARSQNVKKRTKGGNKHKRVGTVFRRATPDARERIPERIPTMHGGRAEPNPSFSVFSRRVVSEGSSLCPAWRAMAAKAGAFAYAPTAFSRVD
jgi:hypothetical protein